MLENKFKTNLIKEIKKCFPNSMVLHLDPTEIQGIPDLIVLYKNHWAVLECKKNKEASIRPNQEYYIKIMDDMSFGRIIYPENKELVIYELQQAFES